MYLAWSYTIEGRPLEVLKEWAMSDDASKLSQQLTGDLKHSQGASQLVLTLIVLLCYEHLLFDTSTVLFGPSSVVIGQD